MGAVRDKIDALRPVVEQEREKATKRRDEAMRHYWSGYLKGLEVAKRLAAARE